MKERGGNISGSGSDSVYRYARAVRFNEQSNFLPTFPQPDPEPEPTPAG
jgi:hypothetical protein